MVSSQSSPSERSQRDAPSYPAPFIVHPTATHKQTFILLHGRGSNGEAFGSRILQSPLSPIKEPRPSDQHPTPILQTAFPEVKFIFPTAKPRRAKWYNRSLINQWFDNVPIDEQDKRQMSREEEEWQLEGLRESEEFVRGILEDERRLVVAQNVVLGGLSQGCAMGLWVLLSWEGCGGGGEGKGRPGGFVGMSGWLPFAGDIEGIVEPSRIGEDPGNSGLEDDPFASSEGSNAVQVCNYIRDHLDLKSIDDSVEPLYLDTPVFLGHGISDEKVKVSKGRRAAHILRSMAMKEVNWKEYDEGHWYKVPDELDDIVQFLGRCLSMA